ncbi:kleisin alpha [Rhodotorula paludigena]|uniref:kleisin alpha n=1 Tax=Rhodotorula paludigena TaxID=86838 RepID=UPI0031815B25
MFFNSDLLTKRGALAQVWMASHLSSKLSKQALTSTSIPKSVQSILGQELLPMALRLSGQLLLGIARIYSRKTKYLLDDAQETLHKVKKAFQNEGRAAVDLPEDGLGAAGAGEGDTSGGRGARDINLRREGGDLEDLLALEFADQDWSIEKVLAANAAKADKGKGKQKALTANIADITLDESFAYDGGLGADFGANLDFGAIDGLDFDPDFALFEGDEELNALAGPSGEKATPSKGKKRARDDGADGERDDDDLSVEMGRRDSVANASDRGSIAPLDLSFDKDAVAGDITMGGDDLGGFDHGAAFDLDLGLMDGAGEMDHLNRNFGGGFDDEQQREKTPTAPSVNGDDATSLQLTPRAAAEIAARGASTDKDKQPPKKRVKHVASDKVIELEWEAGRLEGKDRFKDPEYLPSSRLHLALLNAPSSALLPRTLPKANKNDTALELFAPPGLLAPELQDLFRMPTRREQIRLEGRERKEDRAVEQGRRAMSVVSNLSHLRGADGDLNLDLGLDAFGADDHLNRDFGGGFDGEDLGGFDHGAAFDLDLGDAGADPLATPKRPNKKRRTDGGDEDELDAGPVTPARSVLSALARDELPTYHSEGPLAVFDEVSTGASMRAAGSVAGSAATPSQSQSQGASQSLGTEQERMAAESVTQKSGSISLQSKNTRKAVRVLKDQLEGEGAEADAAAPVADKKVEFTKVAEKASRRAAASFFFELLVLSSADVVKLQQPSAYGEIEVRGTAKLHEIAV